MSRAGQRAGEGCAGCLTTLLTAMWKGDKVLTLVWLLLIPILFVFSFMIKAWIFILFGTLWLSLGVLTWFAGISGKKVGIEEMLVSQLPGRPATQPAQVNPPSADLITEFRSPAHLNVTPTGHQREPGSPGDGGQRQGREGGTAPASAPSLDEHLRARVKGQDRALEVVSGAVRRRRAGLVLNPKAPLNFLFTGPTGVGKTETAKALAAFFFRSDDAMIRIDMGEYTEKYTVSRLLGAAPGYIGHDEGSQLTDAVLARPYSVVLFDEIEKAHPDVFNIFLSLLDEGRLTDSHGRTVDFSNTVVVMTSNLVTTISDGMLEDIEQAREAVKKATVAVNGQRTRLKPELVNRITNIVPFGPLPVEVLREIARAKTLQIAQRWASRQPHKPRVSIDPQVYDVVIQSASADDGARGIQRVLERLVGNALLEVTELSHPAHEVRLTAIGNAVKAEVQR